MPKELPASPSLEHLKKQAKTLLRDVAAKKPAAVRKFSALKLKAAPKLSDAQQLVAHEYGFESWTKLKEHVDAETATMNEAVGLTRKALRDDDAAEFRRVVKRFPAFKARINEPAGDFGSPLINHVKSRAMLDAFLEAGADINARSKCGNQVVLGCSTARLLRWRHMPSSAVLSSRSTRLHGWAC